MNKYIFARFQEEDWFRSLPTFGLPMTNPIDIFLSLFTTLESNMNANEGIYECRPEPEIRPSLKYEHYFFTIGHQR